jgi:thioredoxin
MNVVEVTEANFQEVVERSGILFIDFWAPWCGPCRAFAPVFEKVAERHADVTFAKVNTDEQQGLAGAFQIRSIPTLVALREKVMLFSQSGALPESALEELVGQVRALDMEKVRAQLAAERADQGQT